MELAQRIGESRGTKDAPDAGAIFCGASPILSDTDGWKDPFPVTDIQRAYLVGRHGDLELGGVGAHVYAEFELPEIDINRVEVAINVLVQRHGMLRAVFSDTGNQSILEHVPYYQIKLFDLSNLDSVEAEARRKEFREIQSHQVFMPNSWPLFNVCATRLPNSRIVLQINMDALIIDAGSTEILRREFEAIYVNPRIDFHPLTISFRDYVVALEKSAKPNLENVLEYWDGQFPSMPHPPSLPRREVNGTRNNNKFERRFHIFDKIETCRLKDSAKSIGVTITAFILAAFIEILENWSKDPDFTLNVTAFNRQPLHPEIDDIVGDFTTMMMLKSDSNVMDFEGRAKSVQKKIFLGLENSVLSGMAINRELARRKGMREQLLPVVFTSTMGIARDFNDSDLLMDPDYAITQTPQVWLDHQLSERDDQISIVWDSVVDFFELGLLDEMFLAYVTRLEQLSNDMDARRRGLELTSDPVQHVLPAKGLLHAGFEAQALARPDAIALVSSDEEITYGELRTRARNLAFHLQTAGIGNNELVGVCTNRGVHQVVAALAVLYSGAAYLPIDAEWPAERVDRVIVDSRARVVLVDKTTEALVDSRNEKLNVDTVTLSNEEIRLSCNPSPEDLAYVIYTSGSTGKPKGVMIQHFSAVNTICDICTSYGLTDADSVLAVSAFTFDLSVFDIFGLLSVGGRVVLLNSAEAMNPGFWRYQVEKHAITFWNSVPALMTLLLDGASKDSCEKLSSLSTIFLSGDWIPLILAKRLKNIFPDARVVSLGGATEASIWSIFHEIKELPEEWISIPYGKPLRNQGVFVLDQELRQRCTHAVGEIYIAGSGLAAGYWNDDCRTMQSFVQHPRTGIRLYRTGDLGRYMSDGSIEFLGREDHQVKINGYRIELGEIEAVIDSYPMIANSVVVSDDTKSGSKTLVAFVVESTGEKLEIHRLKDFISAQLPRYMVPSQIWVVPSLPLTANGKVDRAVLVANRSEDNASIDDVAELSETERRIVVLVRETLHLPTLDLRENLLVAGASSLDLVRISNALANEFDFEPDLMRFLDEPCVLEVLQMYREWDIKRGGSVPGVDMEEINL
ncbi:non-ribosomal peptide synthetase [Burkholderia cepacia]|uniref:non-ribosomal peptide synthetase n=1 Tax=Burkholderia cepacia TaxID=292 RepID=UPI002AB70CBD|nr:amino acid adenylation domain-containing protein [Burkholderia cepacia]